MSTTSSAVTPAHNATPVPTMPTPIVTLVAGVSPSLSVLLLSTAPCRVVLLLSLGSATTVAVAAVVVAVVVVVVVDSLDTIASLSDSTETTLDTVAVMDARAALRRSRPTTMRLRRPLSNVMSMCAVRLSAFGWPRAIVPNALPLLGIMLN
jgi:hypothetical protein